MIAEFAAGALAFPEFSPAIFTLPNPFGEGGFPIRWYALAYIIGIALGWWYVQQMIKKPALFGGESPATKDQVDDLIFWIMLGIILGGRLGYIFFYGYEQLMRDPLSALKVWEGGMSFHGGFIGVCLAIFIVSRRQGNAARLPSISDMAAIVAPIGILFGRLANFTNAELYGRHTTSSLGVVFPEGFAGEGTPPAYSWSRGEWVYSGEEMPRHASQLYEAGLEGLLPVIILSIGAYKFGWLKRPWLCTGLFVLMYGLGRSFAENFRMPDEHIGFLFGTSWLTQGMVLSALMPLIGAALIWHALRRPAAGSDAAKA